MNSNASNNSFLGPELRLELSTDWSDAVQWDVDMAGYCTFRVGGKADALLTVSTREELATLMQWLQKNNIRWRVIGRGSNILVQNKGFSGVIIVLAGDFHVIEKTEGEAQEENEVNVRVGAGCSVARLVGWCSRTGLSGLEFMVGIPGSVGGATAMNAGAWGNEIGNRVEKIFHVDLDGIEHVAGNDDFSFFYRQLKIRNGTLDKTIITETVLRLKPGSQKEIVAQCRNYLKMRREKQPLGVASAGSFFKNPPGDSAGRLIDAAGLKGFRKGDAVVSGKHANFIVNAGHASADEIVALMKEVQEKVYRHSGVMLEPEVQLL